MFLVNVITIRDEKTLQEILSASSEKDFILMKNVFAKIKRINSTEIVALKNPVLLIDNVAYIFPNTGTIDENYLSSQFKEIQFHEIEFLTHELEDPYKKDFDIVYDGNSTDKAIKACVQRRAYRQCDYKPQEEVYFELGHYGTSVAPLLRRKRKQIKVNRSEQYILFNLIKLSGVIELNNELIIINGNIEFRDIYQSCLNSGVDMLIHGFSTIKKDTAYTKQ